jgi:tetratricopeptide (TPR) repeat protein
MRRGIIILGLCGTNLLFLSLGGCKYFSDTLEGATRLDQMGQRSQALEAYQAYLKGHPQSLWKAPIYLRIALLNQLNSRYDEAIRWYLKITKEFPGSSECQRALFDLSDLYRNQLKDPANAEDYSKRALVMYLNDPQVRDSVQTDVSSQWNAANALFYKKNFRGAGEIARNILESYPSNMVQPTLWAKVEFIKDRVRRVGIISDGDATSIKLISESPFNNSYSSDFPAPVTGLMDSGWYSPDGKYLVSRKKSSNGIFYLYLAKVSLNSDSVTFKLLPQTFGAEAPVWSPDSQSLVYEHVVRKYRKLEKTSLELNSSHSLFYTNFTKASNLGFHPAYHPAGNKIAFVYQGDLCVMDADGTNVNRLKTKQKFDYTSKLSWSFDGTMIRCQQEGKNPVDDLIDLDAFPSLP